jgi:hypothetical protein
MSEHEDMGEQEDMTRWRLVRWWETGKKTMKNAPPGSLEDKKQQAYQAYDEWQQDRGNEEKRKKFFRFNKGVMFHRNDMFEQALIKWATDLRAENMPSNEPLHYSAPVWAGNRASTAVSHVIYSQGRMWQNKPLQYILQDISNDLKINLVQIYRGAEGPDWYLGAMLKIWRTLKKFFMQDGGEFVVESTMTHIENDGVEDTRNHLVNEMRKLKHLLSTSVHVPVANEAHLGVSYRGDREHTLHFDFEGGAATMTVWDGIPNLRDLDQRLFFGASLVTDIFDRWKDASPGLFVSIKYEGQGVGYGEHCLFLSEYQQAKLHASWAEGIDEGWTLQRDDGKPYFSAYDLAIKQNIVERITYRQKKIVFDAPLTERQMLDIMVAQLISNKTLNDIHLFLDGIRDYRIKKFDELHRQSMQTTYLDEDLIKIVHFSANNLAYTLIQLDTTHRFVKKFLRPTYNQDGLSDGKYNIILAVRYPVLFYSLERLMLMVRYKYFERHTEDRTKWHAWRTNKWHIPAQRRQADLPETYQMPPNPNDPLDWIHEPDKKNLKVFSLRRLAILPHGASFQYLSTNNPDMSKDFFVNSMKDDPFLVYRMKIDEGNEAMWNDLQLFRLNAEIEVSRIGYQFNSMSFMRFRTQKVWKRDFKNPFVRYLERYPRLTTAWRRLWNQAYDNMRGFELIDTRQKEEDEEERRDEGSPEEQAESQDQQEAEEQAESQDQQEAEEQAESQDQTETEEESESEEETEGEGEAEGEQQPPAAPLPEVPYTRRPRTNRQPRVDRHVCSADTARRRRQNQRHLISLLYRA